MDNATFWRNVRIGTPDECWPWTSNVSARGYGYYGDGFAHRTAFLLVNGPIAAGLDICHSCDNPSCCNPAHLRAGTRQDNMNDMKARGRGLQSITPAQRTKLQIEYASDTISRAELAEKYNVSRSSIHLHTKTTPVKYTAYSVVSGNDGSFHIVVAGELIGSGWSYDEAMRAAFGPPAQPRSVDAEPLAEAA